jgi:nitrite reductase/ring-hydroxylating ferredoxin subunit
MTSAPVRASRYVVAKVEDIPEGGRILVTVAGREIGVYKVDGSLYGLLNRCPHVGGPLCEGQFVGDVSAAVPGEIRFDPSRKLVACPWHNWEFDVTTGQSYFDPTKLRARAFRVEVESGGEIGAETSAGRVEGPYRAETVPISVEDDYAVVVLGPARPAQER